MASASSSTAAHPSSSTKSKRRKSKPNPNASQPPPAPQPKSELPLVRYPPFPAVPPDVGPIIPYSQFKEYGIRLHGLPAENDTTGDIEVDGLGIPTVSLRVRHDTDSCKTFTRGREQTENLNQKKAKSSLKESAVAEQPPVKKKDPVARALELRKQRMLLFAKMEWYEQWAEGESMRGTSYDSNLTIVDRVHYAANDFRKGRVWPLASSGLHYLWDQFRLYVGLLGQPPVWYRTDLDQNPDDVVDDIDGDDEVTLEKVDASLNRTDSDQKKEKSILDDDFYDDDSEGDEPTQTQPTSSNVEEKPPQRKRVPPRTPYALHNVVPLALSSESQVKTLLSIASLHKYQKLESFIYTPDTSLRIFLSWYLHYQGFIFSPGYLANLPRLVLFFLEFLMRTKAVYESERALKAAVEVTKKAITEVPAAARMCRLLPDKMGVGCMLHWGKSWVDEDQPFRFGEQKDKDAEEAKREALKTFEEELKKENVQVVSAEGIPPVEEFDTETAEIDLEGASEAGISIQVLSPTSAGFPNLEEVSTAFIEEVNEEHLRVEKTDDRTTTQTQKVEELTSSVQESSSSQRTAILTPIPKSSFKPTTSTHSTSTTDEQTPLNPEMNQTIPSSWDTDPTSSQDKSKLDAWAPKVGQPLMDMLGMTVLPIRYKPGVAERSMRRVREVILVGGRSKEAGMERRWKGVQEELIGKLARVILEPWLDWDDGGIAVAYRKPRVQLPQEEKKKAVEGEQLPQDTEEQNSGVREHLHDAEKDVITILVDPRVAEQISIGMGLAGTWIQMVKVQDYWKQAGLAVPEKIAREGQGTSGHSRGKGRGRGRGRGRGGATSGNNDPIQEIDPSASVETANQEASDSLPQTVSKDEVVEPERGSSSPVNGTTSTQGGHRGGRGRGGYYHQHRAEKEFMFWYVEDIFMAVPSFWMAGKEEEPLVMPEGEDEHDVDLFDLED